MGAPPWNIFAGLMAVLAFCQPARAQMVTIGTPFNSVGDSFYEGTNLGWSLNGPNFFARFGGGSAAPPFGGYNPNAGLQSGFTFNGGPFSGGLNFGLAQGAQRNFVSTTPMVTTLNGQPGYFTDSVQRPFVIGLVPIVGPGVVAYEPIVTNIVTPPQLSPLGPQLPWQTSLGGRRLQPASRARSGDAQFQIGPEDHGGAQGDDEGGAPLIDPLPPTRAERARAEALAEAKQQASAREYLEKALQAERNGKSSVARLYLQMAARRATGPLKAEVEERLRVNYPR